jgi:hypothetical protein
LFQGWLDAGSFLDVTYGITTRRGALISFEWSQQENNTIEWEAGFSWQERTPGLTRAPTTLINIQDIPSAYAQAMQAALQGIDWFEEATSLGTTAFLDLHEHYVQGPLNVAQAGGLALQRAAQAVQTPFLTLLGDGQTALSIAQDYKTAWTRAASIDEQMYGAYQSMKTAAAQLGPEDFAATDDPVDQARAQAEILGLVEYVGRAHVEHGRIVAEYQRITAQRRPESDTQIHVGFAGENLRDVANKYYGNSNLWLALAAFNGLVDSTLTAGQEVIIPPRGAL